MVDKQLHLEGNEQVISSVLRGMEGELISLWGSRLMI